MGRDQMPKQYAYSVLRSALSALVMLTAGCADEGNERPEIPRGEISIIITDASDEDITIAIANTKSMPVVISGLLDPGYRQSPISIEVEGVQNTRSGREEFVGMPVLVDPEPHRIVLRPNSMYASIVPKRLVATMHQLKEHDCYLVSASYERMDQTYDEIKSRSRKTRVCF